ncbi:MAG: hypothetical protein S4CHLAM102_06840 [Chlamydiia bacterium]|nr:hypothetical protein [Chlamydiia bacterium]
MVTPIERRDALWADPFEVEELPPHREEIPLSPGIYIPEGRITPPVDDEDEAKNIIQRLVPIALEGKVNEVLAGLSNLVQHMQSDSLEYQVRETELLSLVVQHYIEKDLSYAQELFQGLTPNPPQIAVREIWIQTWAALANGELARGNISYARQVAGEIIELLRPRRTNREYSILLMLIANIANAYLDHKSSEGCITWLNLLTLPAGFESLASYTHSLREEIQPGLMRLLKQEGRESDIVQLMSVQAGTYISFGVRCRIAYLAAKEGKSAEMEYFLQFVDPTFTPFGYFTLAEIYQHAAFKAAQKGALVLAEKYIRAARKAFATAQLPNPFKDFLPAEQREETLQGLLANYSQLAQKVLETVHQQIQFRN